MSVDVGRSAPVDEIHGSTKPLFFLFLPLNKDSSQAIFSDEQSFRPLPTPTKVFCSISEYLALLLNPVLLYTMLNHPQERAHRLWYAQ